MADKITPARRSENMRRIKSKGMKPEMLVRRMVHRLGYRYRLHRRDLPAKPDLVFGPLRAVVFVHGCFWHQHDCRAGRVPSSNREYWEPKLARNVKRDKERRLELEALGWRVLVVSILTRSPQRGACGESPRTRAAGNLLLPPAPANNGVTAKAHLNE